MQAHKEAYLRRKGVKTPRPPTPEPVYEEPCPESGKRVRRPSFAQKRKENLLSRARGGRPREVDVSFTAVLFAAKLKLSASQTKLDAMLDAEREPLAEKQETGLGDRSSGPADKTWKQKRKDAYLRTHHAPPPQGALDPLSALSPSPSGDGAAAKAEAKEGHEKSFTQKRKVVDSTPDLCPACDEAIARCSSPRSCRPWGRARPPPLPCFSELLLSMAAWRFSAQEAYLRRQGIKSPRG